MLGGPGRLMLCDADAVPSEREHEVAPKTGFGFRKGDEFSQTRWRFEHD
jgi:hypothetical protein